MSLHHQQMLPPTLSKVENPSTEQKQLPISPYSIMWELCKIINEFDKYEVNVTQFCS